MKKLKQMKSAHQLLQECDQGMYKGHWLLAVGFPQQTTVLLGDAPDREHFLKQMLAVGGKPVGLIGGEVRDDGGVHFDFCLTNEYEGEEWAYEYVGAVLYNIQVACDTGMLPDCIASWWAVTPPFGVDDFTVAKLRERNQAWARRQAGVIARFRRTRRKTSELHRTPARTIKAVPKPESIPINASAITVSNTLSEEGTLAKPAMRTAGDVLEELIVAAQNIDTAYLVIGFGHTTKFIAQPGNSQIDCYQMLTERLDEGGDVIGIVTLSRESPNGRPCSQVNSRLIQEHIGQEWAKRYLEAVTNSFTDDGLVAAAIGTRNFLGAQ